MELMPETVCPRCSGPLTWYARGRRAYCQTCVATVIVLPPPYLYRPTPTRRKKRVTYFRGIPVKLKPLEKVYERLWFNGKLIFEGEVDPQEPVIPIDYTAVDSR